MSLADWALRLDPGDARALRGLRLQPGVQVCERAGALWLRGADEGRALERALRRLPALERFRCGADGALTPEGKLLPAGELPDGPWVPLRRYLPLEPQAARSAPDLPERVPLGLVPAAEEREATLLLLPFEVLRRWAETAPAIRLRRLAFAVDGDGQALVRGAPLPPLPGRRFHEDGGVAAPCGLRWDPPVDAEVVAEVYDRLPGELLLLREEGCDVIGAASFLPATRGAVRATAEALGHG